jgi:hypothetical protein
MPLGSSPTQEKDAQKMHKFAELAPLKMSHNPLRHNSITRNWLRLSNSHPPADPLSQEWGSPERRNAPKTQPHRHPAKASHFASSSLLALFGRKHKASKIKDLQPPKDATVATNAGQAES